MRAPHAAVWLLAGLALLLAGCPTREFYLDRSQVDWEAAAIRRLAVPAFDAPPEAWVIADTARRALVETLGRGTAQVVEGPADGRLRGAVAGFQESVRTGTPRRVSRPGMYGLPTEAYEWQADRTQAVQFRLVLRLETAMGSVIWSQEAAGAAEESANVTLDWPGSNPLAPANPLEAPADATVLQRLRQRALDRAIAPLVAAVTLHYAYRDLR